MSGLTDYSSYRLGVKELIIAVLVYMAVMAAVALLFYDSLIPCIAFAPGAMFFIRKVSARKCDQRKRKLNIEFREMLQSLAANMAAGHSLERAFVPVYQELDGMYQGRSYIQKEVLVIIKGIEMNSDIEELLLNLADRSDLEDIRQFAQVVSVAKGSGANLIRMMKKMVEGINGRLEVEEEIDTLITSKRLEQNIMSGMPFVIILYLRVCNPGYVDALYGNLPGVIAMSVCLAVIAMTVMWAGRIINIHV